MDYKTREKLIRRIVLAKLYTSFPWKQEEHKIEFSDPDQELLYLSDLEYDRVYKECLDSGNIITLEQSYEILKERGDWSQQDEEKLDKINNEIEYLQEQILANQYMKSKQRSFAEGIERGKKIIKELQHKKNQLFDTTIEYIAERARKRFLVKNCHKIEKAIQYSPHFLDLLCYYYFDKHLVTEKEIRELARSEPWRLYWSMSKDSGNPLFDRPTTKMTQYQYLLCFWSRMYDYVYEHTERPSDDIIDNDDRLDSWISNQFKKSEQERNRSQIEKRLRPNNSGVGRQEIFIMTDPEGAKDVYALNDPQTKAVIKQRREFIAKLGEVKDCNLPDVQKDLKMALNRQASAETQKRLK